MECRPLGRKASWRVRLGLLGISLVVSVCAAELLLRLLDLSIPEPYGWVGEFPDRETTYYMIDPGIGWRMRPNRSFTWTSCGRATAYHAGPAGFRVAPEANATEGDPTTKGVAGGARIVAAGDSQTWGFGVPYSDCWPARLSRALGGTRVRNLGMPGFGVDQIWQCTRRFALPDKPALIVVGIVQDDFRRTLTAYRHPERLNKPAFAVRDGTLQPLTRDDRPGAVARFLEGHSHVWTLGKHLQRRTGRVLRIGRWWTLNAAILDAMRSDCAAAGVELLFVRIPDRGLEGFPSLAAYMLEGSANYLDPAAEVPPQDAAGLFQSDGHLSPSGHDLIARAVAAWVADHLPALTQR